MKAEERLKQSAIHRIDNTARGPEIGACGPYDLAREAIALLREYQDGMTDAEYKAWWIKRNRFLDGEGGE